MLIWTMDKSMVWVYEQGREGLSPARAALQPSPLRRETPDRPSTEGGNTAGTKPNYMPIRLPRAGGTEDAIR